MPIPGIESDLKRCWNRTAWLNERRRRLHASDCAAGLSTGDWLPVFASKTATQTDDEPLESQRIKLAMEPVARKIHDWKYGGKFHAWPAHTIAVSRTHPWLACTPDGLIVDDDHAGPGVGQIKAWSEYGKAEWEAGPLLYVQVQTQIEMLVTGCTWGYIVVMFGSNSIERYAVTPDPEFLAAALPVLKSFWDDVLMSKPPAPTGSAASREALRRLHPHDNGLTVQLPEWADRRVDRLEVKKTLVADAQKQVDQIENDLRAALGDNTFGVTPNGRWVSWKTTTAGHRVFRQCSRPPGPIEYAPGSVANASDYANAPTTAAEEKALLLAMHDRCRHCCEKLTAGTAVVESVSGIAELSCRRCATDRQHDVATTI